MGCVVLLLTSEVYRRSREDENHMTLKLASRHSHFKQLGHPWGALNNLLDSNSFLTKYSLNPAKGSHTVHIRDKHPCAVVVAIEKIEKTLRVDLHDAFK